MKKTLYGKWHERKKRKQRKKVTHVYTVHDFLRDLPHLVEQLAKLSKDMIVQISKWTKEN